MNPKVSIVIPAYNVESYIFRGIESCLAQTYDNFEIVIVDDGSTDTTWDIVCKYKDMDSRIIAYKQVNGGVSAARNTAMGLASGNYVIFLDSDDWLEPETISTLIALQNKNPDVLVCTDFFYTEFDIHHKLVKNVAPSSVLSLRLIGLNAKLQITKKECRLRSSCYKLFSLDLIKQNGLQFDSAIHHGEDGLFVFSYLHYVRGLYYTHIPLWNILDRPGSATTGSYNARWMTAVSAIEKMKALAEEPVLLHQLDLFLVKRTLGVLRGALGAKPLPDKDIRTLRRILRTYSTQYLRSDVNWQQKLHFITHSYAPIAFLARHMRRRHAK